MNGVRVPSAWPHWARALGGAVSLILACGMLSGAAKAGLEAPTVETEKVSVDTWMRDLAPYISGRSLNHVIIPGAHDADSYALRNHAVPLATDIVCGYACAQNPDTSISDMLDSGIREIDLRVGYADQGGASGSDWWAKHGDYYSSTLRFSQIVDQIVSWATKPSHAQEILFIDFSASGNNSANGNYPVADCARARQRLGTHLITVASLARIAGNPYNATVGQYWATGGNVISNDNRCFGDPQSPWPRLSDSSPGPTTGYYANQCAADPYQVHSSKFPFESLSLPGAWDRVLSAGLSRFRNGPDSNSPGGATEFGSVVPADGFYVLALQTTPRDPVRDVFSLQCQTYLEKMAAEGLTNLQRLEAEFDEGPNAQTLQGNLNVISADYVADGKLVAAAIRMDKKLGVSPNRIEIIAGDNQHPSAGQPLSDSLRVKTSYLLPDGDQLPGTTPVVFDAGAGQFPGSKTWTVGVDQSGIATIPPETLVSPPTKGPFQITATAGIVTAIFNETAHVAVERVFGVDRFDTAIQVAQQSYPNGAKIVFVASGTDFPDALSAGPVAAKLGGPVVLTPGPALREDVAEEIERLKPTQLVMVGGPAAISADVQTQLENLLPDATVQRISGSDRFGTSRAIAEYGFASGASAAIVATGLSFPDALAAGAAIGKEGPVLLVDGRNADANAEALEVLGPNGLDVRDLWIAGGTDAITEGVQAKLATVTKSVARLSGADRYETAAQINQQFFANKGSERILLATGANFPDALSASAWAGASGEPLYLSPLTCLPSGTVAAINDRTVSRVTLLGGQEALSESVHDLIPC